MQYLNPEDDPKNRIIKFPGIATPASWPKASSDFVCIFEAINLIGPAIFPEEWNGRELLATQWRESPRSFSSRVLGNSGGRAPGGLANRNWKGQGAETGFSLFVFYDAHVQHWRLEQEQARWEQVRAAEKRLRQAVDWLAQRCRDEQLRSYARFRTGGSLWPMAAWEWNVDNPLATFVLQGGHKRYFKGTTSPGPFEVYLFFQKPELAKLLDGMGLGSAVASELDLSKLSPFLQMAVRLAIKNQYFSRASCETMPVREAEVEAAWHDFLPDVPASANAVKMIARVMGFPDPLSIQQGSRGRKGKMGRWAEMADFRDFNLG